MSGASRVVPDTYKDSVALMVISSRLLSIEGITAASVVMATPANLDNLVAAGLERPAGARPTDIVAAVTGPPDACAHALDLAEELLTTAAAAAGGAGVATAVRPPSLQVACRGGAPPNLALISVPGAYAAAEAMKALRLGLHVMLFSDNVPVGHERALKEHAVARGLLVMGPDCGTAIVNGVPLGFANVVRRGRIGVVGASGTGTQEVTSRIHNLGAGVSQAFGTGGHDLSDEIGGIVMRQAMRALDADPGTDVIVLVSKPPGAATARAVLDEARAMTTPVVAVFLGADPRTLDAGAVHLVPTLAAAADAAVSLAQGRAPDDASMSGPLAFDVVAQLDAAAAGLGPGQRFVRGVFCGGTFCFEAQVVLRGAGLTGASNTPVTGNDRLAGAGGARHTFVDMGDDEYTRGRPHPMIDPALRDERLVQEASDPATAVLLVDVVLGHGAALDPAPALLDALAAARAANPALVVIGHVCGTDDDPQHRGTVVAALEDAGVLVAGSNADAARWAAHVVSKGER